jgi:hypothetical protein
VGLRQRTCADVFPLACCMCRHQMCVLVVVGCRQTLLADYGGGGRGDRGGGALIYARLPLVVRGDSSSPARNAERLHGQLLS